MIMKFIDKYFYMIVLLFLVFLLFVVSFWNIFIVPLNTEINNNISQSIAQEERILYSFVSGMGQNPAEEIKQNTAAEIEQNQSYQDEVSWLQEHSLLSRENTFIHEAEHKFARTLFIWFVLFILLLTLELVNKVNFKDNYYKFFPLILSAVMLIYAHSTKHNDVFYVLLGTIVAVTSFYFVYYLRKEFKSNLFFWFFMFTGIVFNPVYPLFFNGVFRQSVILYAAVFFIVYFALSCWQNRYKK